MKQHIVGFCLILLLTSCKTTSGLVKHRHLDTSIPFPGYELLSDRDKVIADSIITYALDHEALYSLIGDLKPMSNVGAPLSFPLGKDSTQTDGEQQVVATQNSKIQHAFQELHRWNEVLAALSFGHYQFLLIPFKKVWYGERKFQILLCRTDLLDRLLVDQAPFFAQWGFVPGTDPAVVLTAMEFEEQHDRYRAYGYLFGYPQHAVNFFVEASQEQQQTGEFVKRSFFQIPVHAQEHSYFVYALPEEFQPLAIDSTKYHKAVSVLESYKGLRPKYVDKQGRFNSIELYRNWWERHKK